MEKTYIFKITAGPLQTNRVTARLAYVHKNLEPKYHNGFEKGFGHALLQAFPGTTIEFDGELGSRCPKKGEHVKPLYVEFKDQRGELHGKEFFVSYTEPTPKEEARWNALPSKVTLDLKVPRMGFGPELINDCEPCE